MASQRKLEKVLCIVLMFFQVLPIRIRIGDCRKNLSLVNFHARILPKYQNLIFSGAQF